MVIIANMYCYKKKKYICLLCNMFLFYYRRVQDLDFCSSSSSPADSFFLFGSLSSSKSPLSIISCCHGIGTAPVLNSLKNFSSLASNSTPLTSEKSRISPVSLAYTTLGLGTHGGGISPASSRGMLMDLKNSCFRGSSLWAKNSLQSEIWLFWINVWLCH